ncbi:MAG: TonB-dependent receptor [Pseudomonadales bacterium]
MTIEKRNGVARAAAIAVLLSGAAPMAHVHAAQADYIEEVVVTAQKRSESIQDVPVAVTALTARTLEDMGAQSFMDYQRFLPSLSVLSRGDGNSTLQVRGVSPPGFGTQATTAVYFDETPVTAQFGQADTPVVDIERVELLRGPQGTLYGEGSIGGTLLIISNKPSTDAFTAEAEVEGSSTKGGEGNYAVNGVVNIPLSDIAALRVSGYFRDMGGWVDSAGRRAAPADVVGDIALTDFSNINSREIYGGRAALRLTPSERLTIDLATMYTMIDGDDVDVDVNDPALLSPGFQPNVVVVGKHTSDSSIANYREEWYQNTGLTITYDLDWAEIVSATTYFERDLDELAEQPGYAFFADADSWSNYTQVDEYVSHETRIASTTDSKLQWIGGVFYRDRKIKAESDFGTTYIHDMVEDGLYFGTPIPALPGQTQLLGIFNLPSETTFEHIAAFGSVTYSFTDKIDVTVGLRYFEEDQTSDAISSIMDFAAVPALVVDAVTNGTAFDAPFVQRARTQFDTKDDGITSRFNVTYRANDDWMVYFTAAEGFRSGGVNRNPATDRLTGDPLPDRQAFESDQLWNYELGSKNTWLDGRLVVNSALFFIEWDDIQVPGVINGVQQRWITNAGKAESKGGEVEFVARPTEALSISGSLSYVDAALSEAAIGQPSGTKLPQVADWKYALAVQYMFPLANGYNARLRADYSFMDDQPQNLSRTSPMNPSYELVNLRAVLEADTWSAELFVDNLFDEYASLGIDAGYLGNFRNRPRTAGLRIRADLR